MPLHFVTGLAGTGKSTLCTTMRERGHETYDTDDDGLARWVNKHTGFVHPKSSVKADQRTPQFLKEHDWQVPRETIQKLASLATHKTVLIFGVLGNYDQLKDLLDTTFALYTDDTTLDYRLRTRTTNTWGKSAHERAITMEQQPGALADYHQRGIITINATQPLAVVANELEAHLKHCL